MKIHVRLALAVLCTALGWSSAWAGHITLNDTGLTQCLDGEYQWTTDCAKSGQDAAYGRDVSANDPDDGEAGFSFRKVCRSGEMAGEGSCPTDPKLGTGPDSWGCTYDDIRKLLWEVKTTSGTHYSRLYTNYGHDQHDNPSDIAWLKAATNAETLCGHADWRLPSASELHSIVDYRMGTNGPTERQTYLDPTYFPNVTFSDSAWTNTPCAAQPEGTQSWGVDVAAGHINERPHWWPSVGILVVSTAQQTTSVALSQNARNRFIPSPDGSEVSDILTGLVWQRCTVGLTWNLSSQTCDGDSPTFFSFKTAVRYAKHHRQGGWRIPNVKELASIIDYTRFGPAINQQAFPNITDYWYLTSTVAYDYYQGKFTPVDKYVEFPRGTVHMQPILVQDRFTLLLVRRGRQ